MASVTVMQMTLFAYDVTMSDTVQLLDIAPIRDRSKFSAGGLRERCKLVLHHLFSIALFSLGLGDREYK